MNDKLKLVYMRLIPLLPPTPFALYNNVTTLFLVTLAFACLVAFTLVYNIHAHTKIPKGKVNFLFEGSDRIHLIITLVFVGSFAPECLLNSPK